MLIFLYLLLQTKTNSTLLNEQFPVFFIIYIIELVIYAMPIVIAVKTNNIKQKNDEMEKELAEIKNLMIYQNDILNSMRIPPYNQYYQQQPNNQNFQQQEHNNFSQY